MRAGVGRGLVLRDRLVGNSDDPEVTAFCDKYASDYGEGQKAELYVADVYSTFKLVFDAIERAGSADRQAIRDAVAETKDFPMPRALLPATRTTCSSTPLPSQSSRTMFL